MNESEVQLEHDGADQVQEHLGVDAPAQPLRVGEPPEVEIREEAPNRRRREHDPEREDEPDPARACSHLEAVQVEELPRNPAQQARPGVEA